MAELWSKLESLEPLSEIAQMDWCEASQAQLSEWERKRITNSFPEPKETLGRYKFFDPDEVRRWYILYRKATKNMGRGAEINGRIGNG